MKTTKFLLIFLLGIIPVLEANDLSEKTVEAVKKGDILGFEKLLSQGSGTRVKDNLGRPILLIAIEKEHKEIVRKLLETDMSLNADNFQDSKKNYLLAACETGNQEIVEMLLNHGADLHAKRATGENCRDIVQSNGFYNLSIYLENRGLQLMDKNYANYTVPLYIVYTIISILMTIWVARTLHTNGRVFLLDSLKKEDLANSVNHLLVVGFYLINIGFITLALKISLKPHGLVDSIEILSHKIGMVLVVLGLMHFFNLFMFGRLKKKTSEKNQNGVT